jgi:hypothetical protein
LSSLGLRRLGGRWLPPAYPAEQLEEEMAFIAYHFHWPREEVLALEHRERRGWADQISAINERLNEESAPLTVR